MAPEATIDKNHWDDYSGGDGIGDTPYVILYTDYAKIMDYHPLMEPVPVIPKFPSWIILPLFIVATLVVIIVRNKLSKKGLE